MTMDFSSLFTAQNRGLFKLTMALKGGQAPTRNALSFTPTAAD